MKKIYRFICLAILSVLSLTLLSGCGLRISDDMCKIIDDLGNTTFYSQLERYDGSTAYAFELTVTENDLFKSQAYYPSSAQDGSYEIEVYYRKNERIEVNIYSDVVFMDNETSKVFPLDSIRLCNQPRTVVSKLGRTLATLGSRPSINGACGLGAAVITDAYDLQGTYNSSPDGGVAGALDNQISGGFIASNVGLATQLNQVITAGDSCQLETITKNNPNFITNYALTAQSACRIASGVAPNAPLTQALCDLDISVATLVNSVQHQNGAVTHPLDPNLCFNPRFNLNCNEGNVEWNYEFNWYLGNVVSGNATCATFPAQFGGAATCNLMLNVNPSPNSDVQPNLPSQPPAIDCEVNPDPLFC